MNKVGIINYGAGNIASLINAIEYLGYKPVILDKPEKNYDFSHLILPGVGAFGKLSKNLNQLGFNEYLIKNKELGCYILGICVGMQLLFESSNEGKDQKGLSFIKGNFELFGTKNKTLAIPHVGFNNIKHNNEKIWENINTDSSFYFIHSYRIKKAPIDCEYATSEYGEKFISFVRKNNILGSQFHPEKSHKNGLNFLKNFLKLN